MWAMGKAIDDELPAGFTGYKQFGMRVDQNATLEQLDAGAKELIKRYDLEEVSFKYQRHTYTVKP